MTQPPAKTDEHDPSCLCGKCDPDNRKLEAALALAKKPRGDAAERMDRMG